MMLAKRMLPGALMLSVGPSMSLSTTPQGVVRSTGKWSQIVAIGDIHGDSRALESCLRAASVVDAAGQWIGDAGTLVMQCGDVMHRGHEEWACLKRLVALKKEARASGSDVAMILGNHDNVHHHMMHQEYQLEPQGRTWEAALDIKLDLFPEDERDVDVVANEALGDGGGVRAAIVDLCGATPVCRIEGDTVFVHAALDFRDQDNNMKVRGLDARGHVDVVNDAIRAKLRGQEYDELNRLKTMDTDVQAQYLGLRAWNELKNMDTDAQAQCYSSPYWKERAWRFDADCRLLSCSCTDSRAYCNPRSDHHTVAVLDDLDCNRVVAGHNVRATGIHAFCDGRVYEIDTGMSRFVSDGPKQALVLREGHTPTIVEECKPESLLYDLRNNAPPSVMITRILRDFVHDHYTNPLSRAIPDHWPGSRPIDCVNVTIAFPSSSSDLGVSRSCGEEELVTIEVPATSDLGNVARISERRGISASDIGVSLLRIWNSRKEDGWWKQREAIQEIAKHDLVPYGHKLRDAIERYLGK